VSDTALVEMTDLVKQFPVRGGVFQREVATVNAVAGGSLKIRRGETVGLVGESGCGKSTLGRTVVRLYQPTDGSIRFDGREISTLPARELIPLRRRMQMIFQDPYASLNPRMTVFSTLAEPLLYHRLATRKNVTEQVLALMDDVGLARSAIRKYPHEFSGGQRQRIAIARAMVLKPRLLVLDEPTSALDMSVQAQIVDLLRELQTRHRLVYLFISHDLSVIRALSDEVIVMRDGHMIEHGPARRIFDSPRHPYTRALMSAAFDIDLTDEIEVDP